MTLGPGSSVAEQPVSNRQEAGSEPARGSTPWHYIIIRKDLSGGAALAQVAHAARESGARHLVAKLAETGMNLPGTPLSFGGREGFFVESNADVGTVIVALPRHPDDTRVAVLGATKEQLAELLAQLQEKGVLHYAMTDTDGPLAGMTTAVGLVTEDRAELKPILGELKPFSLK